LATGLDYLSVDENWQSFETELNGSIIRTYDLKTECVRLDTTTASAHVTPEGLFQFGHSKDHRPDLPQLKISMSALDPIGLPLSTTVVAGETADDPLYSPESSKVRQSIGQSGLTHIGDSKMAALKSARRDRGAPGLLLVPAVSASDADGGTGSALGAGLCGQAATGGCLPAHGLRGEERAARSG
jgi:hypothetical protein